MISRRRRRRRPVGVGALVGGALEEVVLERVVGRDARLGVVVEHAQDQVLELEVVRHVVARLARTTPARTSRLDSCHPKSSPASPPVSSITFLSLSFFFCNGGTALL